MKDSLTVLQAISLIEETIKVTKADLLQVEGALNDLSALDSAPFLLSISIEGRSLIFGSWKALEGGLVVRGFLDSDAVPSTLCGALCMSEQKGRFKVAKLAKEHSNAHLLPISDFLRARATQLRGNLKFLAERIEHLRSTL